MIAEDVSARPLLQLNVLPWSAALRAVEDVPSLVSTSSPAARELGCGIAGHADALRLLAAHHWPGNVRS
jgi:DNA-binding NtrC family response regulator